MKPFGPVHAYEPPGIEVAIRSKLLPEHTGLLLLAEEEGGVGFTITEVVPSDTLGQPDTVTRTLYTPAIAKVAFGIVGFCKVEVKPLGPVHAYVPPATAAAKRFIWLPVHTGLLLVAVGALGVRFTVTGVVAGKLLQPATLALTVYVPDAAVVAPGILGFWSVDVKPFGPIQLYVAFAIKEAVRNIVLPEQTGLVPPATGVAGVACVTVVLTITGAQLVRLSLIVTV